jgi:hypothetical protein
MNLLKPPAVQLLHIRDRIVGNHHSDRGKKVMLSLMHFRENIRFSLLSNNIFVSLLSWKTH